MGLARITPRPLGKDRVGILIDNPRRIVSLKWGRHCSAKLGSFPLKKKQTETTTRYTKTRALTMVCNSVWETTQHHINAHCNHYDSTSGEIRKKGEVGMA